MSFWNDENTKALKIAYAEGRPSSWIAAALGCTRNAVIGKIGRLKLAPPKIHKPRTKQEDLPPPKPFYFRSRVPLPPAAPTVNNDHLIPVERRKTIMELTNHTCRWPVGEPGAVDFFFCGDFPVDNSPYCLEHTHRATTPRFR